jgi:HEAT repeat protein
VDDVILGIGGKLFTDDARRSIATAIQEAEKESNNGILKLTRWRAGKTDVAQLKLRVMGTYSVTAPYNCPKSRKIFEEASKALEKEPLPENWAGAITGLALLATGNPDYLPKVQAFARKMGPPTMNLEKQGLGAWDSGYRNLFLCEYYLRTGDKEVLHAIREITVSTARGQGMYGTFGHGFAALTDDGKLHGSIPPYGPVNQAGLAANMAIVMGKKCGVKDPEIDPAIERASRFFAYFVDKGTIPYGEHEPYAFHDNNGKSAMSAVFFAMQGNRPKEARFFASMATAGYRNRECGHTGQGFSYLWGALGANVGGPAAAAAFFKEASTHLDLVRRCDGSFTYDGGEQYGPGKTHDNTYYGNSSYSGLSPTATYVLTYSLALKNLCITGKDANPANALAKPQVAAAIASGRFDLDRLQMTPAQLVAAFGDWSPIARGWAAEELAKRPEAKAMVPELLKMAEGGDAHLRQGACEALGCLKSVEALPVFVRLLTHEDRWLRFKAAQALKKCGADAKPVLPDILLATAKTAEPLQPINWADPVQLTQGQLGAALFAGPRADALKGMDPKLLYPAIRAIANNADGMARATLKGYFENKLTVDDVQALAPDLLAAVKTPSPADKMFSNEIRMGAFKALTKYHFKEGIEAGVNFAKTQGGHGSESRTGEIMKVLVGYGAAARDAIPGLKQLIDELNAQADARKFPRDLNKKRVGDVENAIKAIESATTQPELRTVLPNQPKNRSNH